MKVLNQKGDYVLVEYPDNFYAFGYPSYINSAWGWPVNQCGTKQYVLERLNSRKKNTYAKLHPEVIDVYNSFIKTLEEI